MRRTLEIAARLDRVALAVGWIAAWLVLAMMTVQVLLILGRALFGFGSLQLHEAIIYGNAIFIGAGLAAALARDEHTRIDVLRVRMGRRGRARVDFWACLFLLLPTVVVLLWASAPYVLGAWKTFESSRSVGGLQGVFLFKTVLVVMPTLLVVPGLALALRAWAVLAQISKEDRTSAAERHR